MALVKKSKIVPLQGKSAKAATPGKAATGTATHATRAPKPAGRSETAAERLGAATEELASGLTAAATATRELGRGVGMDAVRRAVERVGGDVFIASVAGQGTEVTLSLPFSVMMTCVMTVEAGGQMFGLRSGSRRSS